MQTHFARTRVGKARAKPTIDQQPSHRSTSETEENSEELASDDRRSAPEGNTKDLLSEIGIFGCASIEPLIVTALVTEVPLLLIGPHGTGKSLLLNRISAALGLEWRHYNASILNFDDLIGFPAPQNDGSLEYIKTQNSIWGANAVFFDEISRCRPDIQNKMFPIVHERRVQGIELKELKYRWAAMNPPAKDDDEEADYLGSEPLDVAFADRFALIIDMPGWRAFSNTEREAIIRSDAQSPIEPSHRLQSVVDLTRDILPSYYESHGSTVLQYVLTVSSRLEEFNLSLSPRRINMMYRSILATFATSMPLNTNSKLKDLAYLVLKNSLPVRCTGGEINNVQLLTAHNDAWDLLSVPKNDAIRRILATQDPLKRLKLACTSNELSKGRRSTIVSDVYASSSPGRRAGIVAFMFESGFVGKLHAAVAEELGSVYQSMVEPIEFSESVAMRSSRYAVWKEVENLLAKLKPRHRGSNYIANYLVHLFAADQMPNVDELHQTHFDWVETTKALDLALS